MRTLRACVILGLCALLIPTTEAFQLKPKQIIHTTLRNSRGPRLALGTVAGGKRVLVVNASSAKSTQDKSSSGQLVTSVASAAGFVLLDIAFRRLFARYKIAFPSSLGGCGVLFSILLASPPNGALFQMLQPGATLIAKWIPVFFVPSLITLPLADSMGSAAELVKVAIVVVAGFYFSLVTTAGSVLGVRKLSGRSTTAPAAATPTPIASKPGTAPKAFSDSLFQSLLALSTGSGVAAGASAIMGLPSSTLLTALFSLSTTLTTFVFGARLPKSFTKLVHPLVVCTSLTWLSSALFGVVTGKTFVDMLRLYRVGSLSFPNTGAGDVLLFLLGPAVISLAVSMYDRRKLMRENLAEVASAVGVATFGGVFGTAAAVRLLSIGSPTLRLSLLSRNITSPLAMAISSILGGDISLAVSFVVVTGLIGANFGASLLDAIGIKDPVARGLGIGAAAHGLGTAAFSNEKDAFPFAAIAMALTASAATVTVCIPFFKRALLQLALGY